MLQLLFQQSRIPPRFVQNLCYAAHGWDRGIRKFCAASGLVYLGFSLLAANRLAQACPEVAQKAKRHGRTVSQAVCRFALDVGLLPLTGTTDAGHMRLDLEVFNYHLKPEEVERIEVLAAP